MQAKVDINGRNIDSLIKSSIIGRKDLRDTQLMNYIKTALTLSLSIFMLGCTTTASEGGATTQKVSAQEISAPEVVPTDMALLKIARANTTAFALKARISVDGEKMGGIKNKEYLSIPVKPGPHEIKLKFNPLSLQKGASFKLDAVAGQTYVYNISSSTYGSVGGSYGNNLTNTFRFVPSSDSYVKACCQLIESPQKKN